MSRSRRQNKDKNTKDSRDRSISITAFGKSFFIKLIFIIKKKVVIKTIVSA